MKAKTHTQLLLDELAEASNRKPRSSPPERTEKRGADQRKRKKIKWEQLVGTRFGSLVLMELLPKQKVICQCDCGKRKELWGCSLLSGSTRSCGCLTSRFLSEAKQRRFPLGNQHKKAKPDVRSLYGVWQSMKQRCANSTSADYPNYGARGIQVCSEWRDSFSSFLQDMGTRPSPQHSLDRVNNDQGYNPANCRWATPQQQSLNKRNNRLLTLRGVIKTATEWAKELQDSLGLVPSLISYRIRRGWSDEKILTTPVNKRN